MGVLLSRSSLYLFDIKRWGVLTLLQLINYAGWFTFAFFQLEVFVQFGWMLFVGLIGGFSYVNIYFDVLENANKNLEEKEKEVSVNVILIFTSIGCTLATCSSLLFANTLFKNS